MVAPFLADRQGGLQFNTAHEGKLLLSSMQPGSMQPGPRGDLKCRSGGLGQVGARPVARFRACGKRSEIGYGKAAEGLAGIRAAMRDNVIACSDGFPDLAIPRPNELDRWIGIVAADGARAPDSHDRCLLFRRMIREPRPMRLWPATMAARESATLSD